MSATQEAKKLMEPYERTVRVVYLQHQHLVTWPDLGLIV